VNASRPLTVASLLAMLLFALHHADDVVRGMAPGGLANLVPIVLLVVWLYGTLELAGRRAGLAIVLAASLFAAAMPVVHMTGSGLAGGRVAGSEGALLFVWTLVALGATATFTALLATRDLWSRRPRQPA
jgi:hypothetical protein